MIRRAQNPLRDERGVAAIEFAVLAPLMVALIIGSVDLAGGFYASQKVHNLAQTVADLAARPVSCGTSQSRICISAGEMSDLFNAARALVTPFSANNLKVTISEAGVFADDNGQISARVIWSVTESGEKRACGPLQAGNARPVASASIPSALLDKTADGAPVTGAVIIVDASLPYSAVGGSGPAINLESTGYATVRNLRRSSDPAALPIGHIRNESGMGTNCVS
jgi:Flp pilus assembly pilin Flp